ncbi:enoyl-CoA hydratase [Trinickia terrae]|uniref:Enoyl-CoA hydratase n=1 Tax=Trinickia terrae TaxID=2571161 RepID=A0A4U1IFG7_9BURK|nr:crotonase/enoyl-CoA hydratase family protein [Trinickia terrae]TKC92473.1 enoyl-CoA hydratase [Trinickia terrae]
MHLGNHQSCRLFVEAGHLSQLAAHYEEGRNVMWMMLRARPGPYFSLALAQDILALARAARESLVPIDFWVTGSLTPETFSAGSDFGFFAAAIRSGQRERIAAYLQACVECVHAVASGFDTGAITIAMVEGAALGGGFAAALAHHFVLAQSDASLGFPEIACNLFPSMGGYVLAARKGGTRLAEELAGSGAVHAAEWHARHGLVDQLFSPGEGYLATRTFIDAMRPKLHGMRAMIRARQRMSQLTRAELAELTEDWIDAALAIGEQDLFCMERLALLQRLPEA